MSELRTVIVGFAMLQYGSTQRLGRNVRGAEPAALPQGEGFPPLEHWLTLLARAQTLEEMRTITELAAHELRAWQRRPEPPPQGESFDELKRRILREGQGWTPKEVALAMRVTPTLVRNVRTEADRDPEYGRPDGSLKHGLALLSEGLSLRQVERITGIPKSTLFDAQKAAA
jgi:hypothetical protein